MASLRCIRYAHAAAFWRAAERFLSCDELGNTQLLALGSRYAEEPGESPPLCFTLESDAVGRASAIVAAGIVLPPRGTLFVSPGERSFLRALIDALRKERVAIGDIVGPREAAETCAEVLAVPYRTHVALQLHRLTEVTTPRTVAGAMRE